MFLCGSLLLVRYLSENLFECFCTLVSESSVCVFLIFQAPSSDYTRTASPIRETPYSPTIQPVSSSDSRHSSPVLFKSSFLFISSHSSLEISPFIFDPCDLPSHRQLSHHSSSSSSLSAGRETRFVSGSCGPRCSGLDWLFLFFPARRLLWASHLLIKHWDSNWCSSLQSAGL